MRLHSLRQYMYIYFATKCVSIEDHRVYRLALNLICRSVTVVVAHTHTTTRLSRMVNKIVMHECASNAEPTTERSEIP